MAREQQDGSIADAALLRPYVPELLLSWPVGEPWQAREGTLVSADVSGFTALSERLADRGREGAEELTILICDCFDGMIEDCHERGGDVVKFGGDALLVWFHGDGHAARACRAASAMRRTIRRGRTTTDGRRVSLGISIGVHSGIHHFFLVEVGGSAELIVTGPGASATVDAESAANRGEILLSPPTAEAMPPSRLGDARDEGVPLRRAPSSSVDVPAPHGRARPPADFVPPVQQAQIVAGAGNEHRQVAIAFLRFGGTDTLIRAGRTDEVARRLDALAASIATTCDDFGVFVLSSDVYTDGGKIILTAGAPISRGGDEERMLRAVRRIIDDDPGLDLCAGVNRGAVFAGDLGSDRRRTYTVMGDSVNLAARLMSKAGPGEVIVSRPAMEWASSRFEYEPLAPFLVKGKSQPIYAGRLGRHLGRRTDLDQFDTELIGRGDELATLSTAARSAWGGRGEVVLITGGPGIGKTRLALEPLRTPGVAVAFARCQPFDRLAAWSVTQPLVRTVIGVDVDADAATTGAVLMSWLGERAPELAPFAPLLGVVVGGEVAATPESDLVLPEFRLDRTLHVLHQMLAVAIHEPTMVLVDDVQHADDATRDLIELLERDPLRAPLLVVATGAPEDSLGVERIVLDPLSDADVAEMVDTLLGDQAITSTTVRSIVQRSEGNPLFAGELVRALAEDPDAEVPSSLEAMVEARLDTLEPADRRLLRTASVLGSEIDIRLLAEMVDAQLIQRADRWDRLDRFLERVGPGEVRFRFDTYHRVVYGGLSYRDRRRLHGRLIDVLESKGATSTRDELALLAFHADRGGDRHRAWRYGVSAARAAADDGVFDEAAELFDLALRSRKRDDRLDDVVDVAERAGEVFEVVGRLDDADRSLLLAQRSLTSSVAVARVLRKRADVAERMGDLDRALRFLTRARRTVTGASWSDAIRERARIGSALSMVAYRQSRIEDAWELATAALSQSEMLEDWSTAAHAALMVHNLGKHLRWEGVEVSLPDVVDICRRAGDRIGEVKYISNQATAAYYEGRWEDALAGYRTAAERSAELGHAVSEATCLNNIAEILSDQGHHDDARSLFRDASRSWRAVGYPVGLALIDANLGRLATRTGDFDRAAELLARAERAFAHLGAASFVTDARLRAIENALLAGHVDVPGWPTAVELDVEPVLRVYATRLRAQVERWDSDDDWDAAIEAARAADVPFELAQLLQVRGDVRGDRAGTREASAIFSGLGVLAAPPSVVRGRGVDVAS